MEQGGPASFMADGPLAEFNLVFGAGGEVAVDRSAPLHQLVDQLMLWRVIDALGRIFEDSLFRRHDHLAKGVDPLPCGRIRVVWKTTSSHEVLEIDAVVGKFEIDQFGPGPESHGLPISRFTRRPSEVEGDAGSRTRFVKHPAPGDAGGTEDRRLRTEEIDLLIADSDADGTDDPAVPHHEFIHHDPADDLGSPSADLFRHVQLHIPAVKVERVDNALDLPDQDILPGSLLCS